MKSFFKTFHFGLRRLRTHYQSSVPIDGIKIGFVSGGVTDGSFRALYQKSLNVLIGEQGVMFVSSFWLPNFMVTRVLIPWSKMSKQLLTAESFEFEVEGVQIDLFGKRVAESIRRFLPS